MTLPDTPRLFFRTWSEADLDLAIALWGDADVTRYLGAIDPRTRLAQEIAIGRDHGIQYWPIFLKPGGAHVGCCGLRPRAPRTLELGFHLHRAFWGTGLASEAARATIELAFTTLGASALFAGHHPDNAASRRMLTNLGFAHTHDEPYAPTGRMHPSYLLHAPKS